MNAPVEFTLAVATRFVKDDDINIDEEKRIIVYRIFGTL